MIDDWVVIEYAEDKTEKKVNSTPAACIRSMLHSPV